MATAIHAQGIEPRLGDSIDLPLMALAVIAMFALGIAAIQARRRGYLRSRASIAAVVALIVLIIGGTLLLPGASIVGDALR
ncbi:hypothetical protein [Sphingopyxis terrae]|uniref:Uncharacterized protein n=2 Tax=Sphingopyxis terrae TaxID=33052 RepID=A0A1Y6FP66_9SPHN|nr:hypothetical protein [Sphingopyxis terrae]SMQ76527.1 hypothetical protein SAMN06295984_1967 [Sphingopyxis terrae subsp. ummariensis]